MPRRSRRDQTEPVRKRTRTGCWGCRKRRIKCDEAKPQCRNCILRGLACDNGIQLKWHAEFESRGLAFGRQGVWAKDPHSSSTKPHSPPVTSPVGWCGQPRIGPHHFLHTLYTDFQPNSQRQEVCDIGDEINTVGSDGVTSGPDQSFVPTQNTLFRSPSPLIRFDGFDYGLLEYYVLRLCPLTSASQNSPSPFANLIVPLFGTCTSGPEDVLLSVMAFSARHRSIADDDWSQTAMTLKGRVLTSLQRRLGSSGVPTPIAWDPQILIIMMFLCLYEIVDNCDHRWVIHLKASQDIIRRRKQLPPPRAHVDNKALSSFAERFFAFQDVISRTACCHAPLFGAEYWESNEHQRNVDSWMGCSPELVRILSRITELSSARGADRISADDFTDQAQVLRSELDSMRSDIQTLEDDDLAAVAELKRLSALLFYYCELYDASPSTPLVSRLVAKILRGVHHLLRGSSIGGLAFPVFVAAVELEPADEELFCDSETGESVYGRRLVLEALDVMSRHSLSNVPRTRAVIRKVWALRDMHLQGDSVIDESPTAKSAHMNDWGSFVGPNSLNISLA
ncbi:fungal-specific transcription factor domain-containing protein [Pseudomassariella vexata]|uniref:Fungal-specific transcription factor domain-domain-containing protein n=1 Tax=Pseudomassariella vexata TaxID=1141098 RepID=A0A1Y2DC16_9PEZI|nr:fungal-specific transcription factor domain-containing protein [Pseudomassariella vexata]ORY56656.1 fungal-specific transcription factor domain-domain-containing protein [Pseudomassariella vexata]